MAWYWYVVIYAVGYLAAWRIGYSKGVAYDLEQIERENQKIRAGWSHTAPDYFVQEKIRRLQNKHKEENAGFAAAAAVIWPLLMVITPAYMFVTRPTRAEKKYKQREAERTELAHLRKQAKALGLPFLETDDTNR